MKTITTIASLFFAGFFLSGCAEKENKPTRPAPEAVAVSKKMSQAEMVKRGEYIVSTSACDDCHTPKVMTPEGPKLDMARRLSGHRADLKVAPISDKSVLKDFALCNMELTAWVGPWGTSFAANLTPDDTGVGNWSFDQFKKAIREGKYKGLDGGRTLLPPMPWEVYKNFTDEDLACIFAYLQSLPPVKNLVPAPVPPAS